MASIDCENGLYRVYVVSDDGEKKIEGSLKILSADRRTLRECVKLEACVENPSSTVVFEAKDLLGDGEVLICDIWSDTERDRTFYRHGRLEMCPAEVEVLVEESEKRITLSAKDKYVHAVTISGNVICNENCFSLLPNETRTITYRNLENDLAPSLSVEAYTLS